MLRSLEESVVLIDGDTKTLKHEIKKIKWIYWSFVSTFTRFISTTNNFFCSKIYSGRGTKRTGRGYIDEQF